MASSVSPVAISDISRRDFGDCFVWGAATAAFQIEGAAAEDGRAPSLWDIFATNPPSNIKDGKTANVAIDHYHRFKEDVQIMKKMGLDAYRFSISWPRILPGGRLSAGINRLGIDFYNDLINELIANDIVPYVTLFHWDVPQALEAEYGGFLCDKIVDDFREFADLCFWEFGDRVKNWITLNEPWTFAAMGYAGGGAAPNRGVVKSVDHSEHIKDEVPKHRNHRPYHDDCEELGDPGTEPYIVTHNLILAHGEAVKLYRDNYKCQGGKIGITLVSQWWEPYHPNSKEDIEACDRMKDFFLGWYMAPITEGDYPERMREIVKDRLPKFTDLQKATIKGSFDFIGLNYYTGRYAEDISKDPISVVSYNTDSMVKTYVNDFLTGKPIGPCEGDPKDPTVWLYSYPPGMFSVLKYLKDRYYDPQIYITENGWDEVNDIKKTIREFSKDEGRIQYIHDHLKQVKLAKDTEKVNVKGYFVWSLIDNYEWQSGYTVRFGMVFVDYNNRLTRFPKLSALWYMNFLTKGEPVQIPDPNKVPTKRPLPVDPNDDSTGQKPPKRKVIYRV